MSDESRKWPKSMPPDLTMAMERAMHDQLTIEECQQFLTEHGWTFAERPVSSGCYRIECTRLRDRIGFVTTSSDTLGEIWQSVVIRIKAIESEENRPAT